MTTSLILSVLLAFSLNSVSNNEMGVAPENANYNKAIQDDLKIYFPLPHRGPVLDLAFTSDGKKIITMSEDHTIKIHDFTTHATLKTIDINQNENPLSLALMNDGRSFIYSTNLTSHIIDIETGKETGTLDGISGRIVMNDSIITSGTYSCFSAENLINGRVPRAMYNLSLKKSGSLLLTPSVELVEKQYSTNCNSCGYDAYLMQNGVLTYMDGSFLYFFNIRENRNTDSIYIDSGKFNYAFCFSADTKENRVFIPSASGITEFNIKGDSIRFIPIRSDWKKGAMLSPYRLYYHNGRHFICNYDGTLIIVDDKTSNVVSVFRDDEWVDEHEEGIISLAFHPTKNIVALGFEKKNYFRIIDIDNLTSNKFENIKTSQVRKIRVSEGEDSIYIDTRFSGSILSLKYLSKSVVLKQDHGDSDVDFKTGSLVTISPFSNSIAYNNIFKPLDKDTLNWLPTFGKKVSFVTHDSVVVALGSADVNGDTRADAIVIPVEELAKKNFHMQYGVLYSHPSNLDLENMELSNRLMITYCPNGEIKYLEFGKNHPDFFHGYYTDENGNPIKVMSSAFETGGFDLYDERYKIVYAMAASPDKKHIVVVGESNFPYRKLAVAENGKNKISFETDSTDFNSICFTSDSTILAGTTGGKIVLLKADFANKRITRTGQLDFSDYGISEIKYLAKRKQYIIVTEDNKVNFTDDKLKKLVSYFSTDDENFIFMDTLNNYFASRDIVRNIFFSKDNRLYSFDQFDCYFNRPDLIVKSLLPADTIQYRIYNELYKKRMKKAGIKEETALKSYNLPVVRLKDPEIIPESSEKSSLDFEAIFDGNGDPLLRAVIWINEVPVEKIECRNKRKFTRKINLDLAYGLNKIEISVTNINGVESYWETFYTTWKPSLQVKPDLYLVTIGGSKFSDNRYNLNFASKDATDIKDFFTTNKTGIYNQVHVYSLINENVTIENIGRLKEELRKAGRNDVVLVTFAGHGLLDKKWDYYLSTYNINFSNPSEKGLPYEELENLLDGIKPLKKSIMIDACHSGEVDKDEMLLSSAAKTTSKSDITFRAAGASVSQKNIGIKTTSELMKEFFADIRRGTGATVISSAEGGEFAMESDQWKNGLFTYCLLSGLNDKSADLDNDGQITLSELQKYVGKQVTQLSKGQQKPTSRIENMYMDFRLW